MKKLPAYLKSAIAATVVAAPLCFYIGQSTFAAGESGGVALVDKEFESACHKHFSQRFYNRIGASDEQRQKLDSLWQSTADSTRPLREQLRAGVIDVGDLIASDTASDEQIADKVQQLRAIHQKIGDTRLATLLKARKLLTHDQRQLIDERIKDFIKAGSQPHQFPPLVDPS